MVAYLLNKLSLKLGIVMRGTESIFDNNASFSIFLTAKCYELFSGKQQHRMKAMI